MRLTWRSSSWRHQTLPVTLLVSCTTPVTLTPSTTVPVFTRSAGFLFYFLCFSLHRFVILKFGCHSSLISIKQSQLLVFWKVKLQVFLKFSTCWWCNVYFLYFLPLAVLIMLSLIRGPKLFSLPKVNGPTTDPHGHHSAYANTDMTTTQKNNITILCSSNFAKNITRILTFYVCKQQHWVNTQLLTNTGLCTSVCIKGSRHPHFAAMWKEFKTFLHITFIS